MLRRPPGSTLFPSPTLFRPGPRPAKHAIPPAGQQRAIRRLVERKSAAIGVPQVLYKWMGQMAAAVQAAAVDRSDPEFPVRALDEGAQIAGVRFLSLSQVQERRQALSVIDLQAEAGNILRRLTRFQHLFHGAQQAIG